MKREFIPKMYIAGVPVDGDSYEGTGNISDGMRYVEQPLFDTSEFVDESKRKNVWKKYKRKGLSEMRPYEEGDDVGDAVSISPEDRKLNSLFGGMIARNPKNHDDLWYVAKRYFDDNLEEA